MASKKTEIPKHELQALARAFADDIVAFFESEKGQREYEEWFQQKEKNEEITPSIRTCLNDQKEPITITPLSSACLLWFGNPII